MENGNYYNQNQQYWQRPVPPPQPPKKPFAWVKWVVISLVITGAISVLLYYVASAGRKFGNEIGNFTHNLTSLADSTVQREKEKRYDALFERLKNDSAHASLVLKLTALRNGSDSLCRLLDRYDDGFGDTLKNAGSLGMIDRSWASHYFIQTGRARRLKLAMYAYRQQSILALPASEQDSSLHYLLMIDEFSGKMPRLLKGMSSFENLYFNQPPVNVRLNIEMLKTQIHTFESKVLERWERVLDNEPSPPRSDTAVLVL